MANKKQSFMRIDKELLKELARAKLKKKESYADVVERLLKKEMQLK
jgi:predicted CopG family antitoxin